METNKYVRRKVRREKSLRFSIRKFSSGAASVVVATASIVGAYPSANVSANTISSTSSTIVTNGTNSQTATSVDKAVTHKVTYTDTTSTSSSSSEERLSISLEEGMGQNNGKEAETAAPTAPLETAVTIDEAPVSSPVVSTRLAATTYRVQYRDAKTGKVIYQRNYSISEQTTDAADVPHEFKVRVASEVGKAPALNNYVLVGDQTVTINGDVIEATVTERGDDRTITVNVHKVEVTELEADKVTKGYTGFRAPENSAYKTDNVDVAISKTWTINEAPTDASKQAAEASASVENLLITTPINSPNSTRVFDKTNIKGDPDTTRYTFGINWLGDPTDGDLTDDFNERNGKEWYMTFSLSKDRSNTDVKVNLVDRITNTILETKTIKEGDEGIIFANLEALKARDAHKIEYRLSYRAGEGGMPGSILVNQQAYDAWNRPVSAGTANHQLYLVSRANPTSVLIQNNHMNTLVPGLATQGTSYKVVDYTKYQEYKAASGSATYLSKQTGNETLLAKLTQKGQEGQYFNTGGELVFNKYELVEAPKDNAVLDGVLVGDIHVGARMVTASSSNTKRIFEVTREDGTGKIEIYVLNPNGPRFAELAGVNTGLSTEGYVKLFETDELAPGEWNSKAGSFNFTTAGMTTSTSLAANTPEGLVGATRKIRDNPDNGYFNIPHLFTSTEAGKSVGSLNLRMSNDREVRRQDVTYFYVEKGSVFVHYEDAQGTVSEQQKLLTRIMERPAMPTIRLIII